MPACRTNAYFLTGELQRISGAGTYTVEYTYDGRGRMKTMSTWQGATPAVTTWNYSADRGLLASKVYADNQGPSYTYKASGRLETRVWARGVTNTYSYNAAGDLESIAYSDGTSTVTNAFNRLGRLAVVAVGTNKTELAYNYAGQLLSESHSGGLLSGLAVQNGYDSSLRRTSLTNTHANTNLLIQSFSYDPVTGRLLTVSGGNITNVYSYLANSPQKKAMGSYRNS